MGAMKCLFQHDFPSTNISFVSRKALVKYIRRKLTAKLSGYLDEEIEKHSQLSHIDADQQEKIVDVIFEKVQKSKQ